MTLQILKSRWPETKLFPLKEIIYLRAWKSCLLPCVHSLYEIFPDMAPLTNTSELRHVHDMLRPVEAGLDRTAQGQALYQLGALGVTLGLAMSSGALTGSKNT